MPKFAANLTMLFTEHAVPRPLRRGRGGGLQRRRISVSLRFRRRMALREKLDATG